MCVWLMCALRHGTQARCAQHLAGAHQGSRGGDAITIRRMSECRVAPRYHSPRGHVLRRSPVRSACRRRLQRATWAHGDALFGLAGPHALDGSRHRGYARRLWFPAFGPLVGIGAGTGRECGVSGSATWPPTRRGAPSLKEGAPSSGRTSSCRTSSTSKWGSLLHADAQSPPARPTGRCTSTGSDETNPNRRRTGR
jgi:hypothetical protein